jgi:hypothetical protein
MRQLLSCSALIVLACQSAALAATGGQRISSAVLKRPNIVIRGANLSKVEIWALPTGTGFEHDEHAVLGRAVRKGAAGAKELWIFRLPPCDSRNLMLASGILVVGFDASGAEVGRKELPSMGAMEIYQTFCVKN